MFKKKNLVASKGDLRKALTKVTKEYATKASSKETTAKKTFPKLVSGSPPDIGDAGARIVVDVLFEICTKPYKGVPKWQKTDIDKAVVHYFNDHDQFVIESFTKACEEMCKPVVLIIGPTDAGKTSFMANITGNSFRGKELIYVNWVKLNTNKKETFNHHLKSVAIVVFVVPLFGSGGNASASKTLSELNQAISDFQMLMDEEPQPRFLHLVFNWHSEEQLMKTIPHIDCHSLFPSMVISIDVHAPPRQVYESFQSYCRALAVNDSRVFTHTMYGDDVKKSEEAWQKIWDITTKGPPENSSDSD